MGVYAVHAAVVGMVCFFLGLAAYQGFGDKTDRRLFLLMTLSLAWFLIFAGLTYGASTEKDVRFWYRLSSFGFAFFYALHLDFCLHYTGILLPRLWTMLLYVPVPFVIGSTWFYRSLFDRFEKVDAAWKLHPAYDSFWFWFYILYYASMILSSILVLLYRSTHTDSSRFRKQLRFIVGIAFLTLIVGSLLDFILPALPFFTLPPLGPLAMSLYVIGLWYALYRYDFLGPRPESLLEEMLENFGDFVFLLDAKYRIKRMNRPAWRILFPQKTDDLGEFPAVTLNSMQTRNYLEEARRNGFLCKSVFLDFRTSKGAIHANGMIYKICQSVKEPDGYLVLSRENRDRKKFIQTFKLTSREMEILYLCLQGESNPEIASQLGISLRTVESHLLHIYNKCGTDNKIELFNLCRSYFLLPSPEDS